MTFIEGQQEKRTYRIAYEKDAKQGNQKRFLLWLESQDRLELVPLTAESDPKSYQLVLRGTGDDDSKKLSLEYRGSRPESSEARRYLLTLQEKFNREEQEAWAEKQGFSPETVRPFLVSGNSRAKSGDVGGYLLGALLPIGLLVMIALGGAYPAIDTTAGERERGTWETLQSSGPGLGTVLVSKYLFVSLVCCLSGVLNLLAMLLSIRSIVAPLLRDDSSITFQVGPSTMLILLCGVVGVSFFVAAALLLCAIFARTFREGQALTTPMFMMIALPVLPLSDPSLQLNSTLACVPLVNLALVWRQALQGQYNFIFLAQTVVSLTLMVSLCLWFGSRLLKNESLMTGQGQQMTWSSFMSVLKGVFGGK